MLLNIYFFSANLYETIMSLTCGIISFISFIMFHKGYKLINYKKHNSVNTDSDLLFYRYAFIQVILICINYVVIDIGIIYYTLRAARLFHVMGLCLVMYGYHLNNNDIKLLSKILYISIGFCIVYWVLTIIFGHFNNECGQSLYLVYDLLLLIFTITAAILTYLVIQRIINTEKNVSEQFSDPNAIGISLDELSKQKHNYFDLMMTTIIGTL